MLLIGGGSPRAMMVRETSLRWWHLGWWEGAAMRTSIGEVLQEEGHIYKGPKALSSWTLTEGRAGPSTRIYSHCSRWQFHRPGPQALFDQPLTSRTRKGEGTGGGDVNTPSCYILLLSEEEASRAGMFPHTEEIVLGGKAYLCALAPMRKHFIKQI